MGIRGLVASVHHDGHCLCGEIEAQSIHNRLWMSVDSGCLVHPLSTTRPEVFQLSTFPVRRCVGPSSSAIVESPRKTQGCGKSYGAPLSHTPLPDRMCFRTDSVLSAAHIRWQKGPIMAQQQGLLTITGYVGANPVPFNREGMPHASSFRLASTRHYFDNRAQLSFVK